MTSLLTQEVNHYFSECLQFLHKYEWIYNFQLTHFFTDRVWENIPSEWINILTDLTIEELNEIPFGYFKQSWPDSLKHFLQVAISLTLPRNPPEDASPLHINDELSCGMSPKKQHEVCHLASVVNRICKENHCKAIVDVGSGLGYLSLVLSHQLGYYVLGVECQEARCRGAEIRANKCYKESISKFQSRSFSLKDDAITQEEFGKLLQEHFGNSQQKAEASDESLSKKQSCTDASMKQLPVGASDDTNNEMVSSSKESTDHVTSCDSARACCISCGCGSRFSVQQHDCFADGICLIGLHCCGDLTPTMLKLFAHSKKLKALVVLSCCYHHMTATEEGMFHHFPMSSTLKQILQNLGSDCFAWKITTYGLRLAAQETRSRWRSQDAAGHTYHQNNVIFRGILDLVMQREKIKLSKSRRKLISKGQCTDFETYIEAALSRVELDDSIDKARLKEKLLAAHADHSDVLSLVEPFTCLQVVLQGVLETLILKDRQQYLLEHHLEAQLLPILDDNISPRNVAIMAIK